METKQQRQKPVKTVFYFDATCGLCQKSVKILKSHNFSGRLEPLADAELPDHIKQLDTAVLFIDGAYYIKSDAVLKALTKCRSWIKIASIFLIVPRFIRDWIYDLVAKNRNNLSCKI